MKLIATMILLSLATSSLAVVPAAGGWIGWAYLGEVGYLGISRGGWTAPLAVDQDPAAAFLMLLVPPAASPARQEHGSRLARLRAEGYPEADVDLADRTLAAAWRFVETGSDADWFAYASQRVAAVQRGIPGDLLPPAVRDPEQWRWSTLNMLQDPQPVLRRIHVPVLAVFGELDASVLTVEHRPLLESALAAAGNDDATVVTVPGVGHGLARPWGSPHHRTTGVGPEGFDVVLAWARERGLIDPGPR